MSVDIATRHRRSPGARFELPGLWFTEEEAYALVTMQHLLSSLDQGGLIGPHIAPLVARLDAILGEGEATSGRFASGSGC
jgi:predicted DNA-binding transcriptional regulator YafY